MTDIVERLRDWPKMTPVACTEAADEIERLRSALLMAEACSSLATEGVDAHAAVVEVSKQTMVKLIEAEAEIEQLRAEIDEWRHRAETAEARLGIVSAICLECWREGRNKTIYPMGYYNVPCLRHGQERPNEPIRLITEADIRNDKRGTS